MTARINDKGQLTLPKEIWEQLGLSVGDSVRFEKKDGYALLSFEKSTSNDVLREDLPSHIEHQP